MSTVWNANNYDNAHSYVWTMAADLIDLLAPQAGERILDVGCGTGHLTAEIAQRGPRVVGLDASEEMVARARENYPGIEFRVGNAADFAVDAPFDAVFSNATLHWVKDARGAANCIFRALRPGGRFVAEFGGAGNVRTIMRAIAEALKEVGAPAFEELSPWHYPSIAQYGAVLEEAGLELIWARLFDRPTPVDVGLRNWVEQYGSVFLNAVGAEKREDFLSAIEEHARAGLFKEGKWAADYRRLRIVAMRTAERQ
jgi:trans-aconitate methyltransferase